MSAQANFSRPSFPRITLRPVSELDTQKLYHFAVVRPHEWPRVGAHGPPSPSRFAELLWAGVQVQFLADRLTEQGVRETFCLATIFNEDPTHRTAWFEVVPLHPIDEAADLYRASLLLVSHAFDILGVRKLYMSVPAYLPCVLGGLRCLLEEGNLTQDYLYAGTYWDRRIYSIRASSWAGMDSDEIASLGGTL